MEVSVREQAQPSLLRDMVMLTKPRIISLLLVTTVAPMFVAGNPGWLLCLIVWAGRSDGGRAKRGQQYLDRDIDTQMARTRPSDSEGRRGERSCRIRNRAGHCGRFCWRAHHVLNRGVGLAALFLHIFVYTRCSRERHPEQRNGGAAGFPVGGGRR